MRWRCAAGIFHRNAVFSRRTSALLHLPICSPESDGTSESQLGTKKQLTQAVSYIRNHPRFTPLWMWYYLAALVIGFFQRRPPDLARRGSIAPAKGAIEVGQITEPDIERDRADRAIDKPGIAQHTVCAREALVTHERGEGEPLVLE